MSIYDTVDDMSARVCGQGGRYCGGFGTLDGVTPMNGVTPAGFDAWQIAPGNFIGGD